jgi:hypothetical protein
VATPRNQDGDTKARTTSGAAGMWMATRSRVLTSEEMYVESSAQNPFYRYDPTRPDIRRSVIHPT